VPLDYRCVGVKFTDVCARLFVPVFSNGGGSSGGSPRSIFDVSADPDGKTKKLADRGARCG